MESVPDSFRLTAASSLNKYPAKQHAQDVAQKLGVNKGLIYLPGQPTIWQEDSDFPYPFRQRRYFYYLSGVDERDCFLTYDIGKDHLVLYIPVRNQREIIYNGRGLTIAEAYDRYDVDTVKHAAEVQEAVQRWTKFHPRDGVFLLHPTQEAFPGQNKLPGVDFTRLQFAIDRCRVIKDPHEIELIRKANDITAEAHRTVLTNIAGLQNEAQVEAIFKEICTARMAKNQAYEVIAASGENAATLHYMKNDEPLAGRQLLCLDAGCEWELYASDVTRTFPLSGSWPSKEANAIYDLVQSMQTACIERVKPGVRFLDLHHLAHQIAVRGLLQLGILHGEEKDIIETGTSIAFFPHGLGHHMGLEVHDVSSVPINSLEESREEPVDPTLSTLLVGGMCRAPVDVRSGGLEDGMIVTVEPGIYFNRYSIEHVYLASPAHSKFINKDILESYYPVGGVRIEDDILVTKTGYENLTTAPKGQEMLDLIKIGFRSVGQEPMKAPSVKLLSVIRKAPEQETTESVGKASDVPRHKFAKNTCRVDCSQPLHTGQKSSTAKDFTASSVPPKTAIATSRSTTGKDRTGCSMKILPTAEDPLPERPVSSLLDGFQLAIRNAKPFQRAAPSTANQSEHNNSRSDSIDEDVLARSSRLDLTVAQSRELLAEQEPFVPGKTPQVPQKPPAYRASIASFHDAVRQLAQDAEGSLHEQSGIRSDGKDESSAPHEWAMSDADNDMALHHQGVGLAATSRLCGLRRAQSQMLPGAQRSIPPPPPRRSFVPIPALPKNGGIPPPPPPQTGCSYVPSPPPAGWRTVPPPPPQGNLSVVPPPPVGFVPPPPPPPHVQYIMGPFPSPGCGTIPPPPPQGWPYGLSAPTMSLPSIPLPPQPAQRFPPTLPPPSSGQPSVASQANNIDQDTILRIAAVAATYIHSIPQNRDKDVNGDEIRRILEANPTLTDLCRMLKAIDLTVRELDLAGVLIDAVPNVDFHGLARPIRHDARPVDVGRLIQAREVNARMRKRPHTVTERSRQYDIGLARQQSRESASQIGMTTKHAQENAWDCTEDAAQACAGSEASLSGTHEWVEQRMRRMMSDNFLGDVTRRR